MLAYDNSFSPPAPIARVSLRHPGSGFAVSDVPMLIDSGADVTLIPQSSVDLLGLEITLDQTYELKSFDGSTSISNAVELDLIFLRKAFKGRFLLMNEKCGILGRDVLNHIALLSTGRASPGTGDKVRSCPVWRDTRSDKTSVREKQRA